MESAIEQYEIYLLIEKRISPITASYYKNDVVQFHKFLQNIHSLNEIKKEHLKLYVEYLRSIYNNTKSICRKITSLKSFFKFCSDKYAIENFGNHLIFPKTDKNLPKFLSTQQVRNILEEISKDQSNLGIRNKLIFSILYTTGMRVSELSQLRIRDIKFDDRLILVNGKGSKERLIPAPEYLIQEIINYIQNVHSVMLEKRDYTDLLFFAHTSLVKRPLTRQQVLAILNKIGEKLNINLTPHILRHSIATHLLQSGMDVRMLQKFLGHESIRTVEIYTHLNIAYLREIYDKKFPRR